MPSPLSKVGCHHIFGIDRFGMNDNAIVLTHTHVHNRPAWTTRKKSSLKFCSKGELGKSRTRASSTANVYFCCVYSKWFEEAPATWIVKHRGKKARFYTTKLVACSNPWPSWTNLHDLRESWCESSNHCTWWKMAPVVKQRKLLQRTTRIIDSNHCAHF